MQILAKLSACLKNNKFPDLWENDGFRFPDDMKSVLEKAAAEVDDIRRSLSRIPARVTVISARGFDEQRGRLTPSSAKKKRAVFKDAAALLTGEKTKKKEKVEEEQNGTVCGAPEPKRLTVPRRLDFHSANKVGVD
jgi:hypothetical protein